MKGNEIGYFETLIREDHKFGRNKYCIEYNKIEMP